MTKELFRLALSSVRFRKKNFIYQLVIVMLLGAVITGSLLTGFSVKKSLKLSVGERLGSTGILISSGYRYFSLPVTERLEESTGSFRALRLA